MKVIALEPRKNAYEKQISGSLKSMQEAVGGYIEVVPLDDDVCVICNENAYNERLPLNRQLFYNDYPILILGNAFLCRIDGEEFAGLTDQQYSKYYDLYKYPQHFVKVAGEITAIKYNAERG